MSLLLALIPRISGARVGHLFLYNFKMLYVFIIKILKNKMKKLLINHHQRYL